MVQFFRTTFKLLLIAPLLFVAYSAENVAVADPSADKIINQQRIVQDFDKVNIYGRAIVNYIASRENEYGLEVETKSHLLKHVESDSESGQLNIYVKHNSDSKEDVVINISAPTLEKISLNGELMFLVQNGRLRADNLEIKTTGNSSVSMEIDVDELSLKMNGTGNVTLSGRAKDQSISIDGDASFKGAKLLGDLAEVVLLGNALCDLNISDSMDVSIKGIGMVTYVGSPTVEKSILGAGQVTQV